MPWSVRIGLNETPMYEFWTQLPNYLKYEKKVKLCYLDKDRFLYEKEIIDFYKDIADNVDIRVFTSRYSNNDNKALPKLKIQKVKGIIKK